MDYVDMDGIRAHYGSGAGRHWFDRDSMRFFGTRLAATAYSADAGASAYFVTSERPPHGGSKSGRYRVRMGGRASDGTPKPRLGA